MATKQNKAPKFIGTNSAQSVPPLASEMKACEPPKRHWKGFFRVRGMEVVLDETTEDRDQALVFMVARLNDVFKENWGITFVGMHKV
jgi:hypothetical protein